MKFSFAKGSGRDVFTIAQDARVQGVTQPTVQRRIRQRFLFVEVNIVTWGRGAGGRAGGDKEVGRRI